MAEPSARQDGLLLVTSLFCAIYRFSLLPSVARPWHTETSRTWCPGDVLMEDSRRLFPVSALCPDVLAVGHNRNKGLSGV